MMIKKIYFLLLFLAIANVSKAQDSTFIIPLKKGNLKIVGVNKIYPTYLADPLENRAGVATYYMKYSDLDFADKINQGKEYRGHLVIYPAFKFSLLQYRPKSNPKLGVEGEIGIMLPVYLRQQGNDLIGVDGIYYFAVSGNPTEWLYLRFSKHHICTHIGDEYSSGRTLSVTDIDPAKERAPVNDDFRFGATVMPLYFLGRPDLNILKVYGEIGYFDPGSDFLGERQSKPHTFAYMNYLAGMELEYYFPGRLKCLGGVFTGINYSTYQENGFAPNINIAAGYIFPQDRFKKRMRIGIQYYNGRSLLNQFYNRKEKFIGAYLAIDV